MPGLTRIAFTVLAGVACGYGANLVIGGYPQPMEAARTTDVALLTESWGATPNHDPHHIGLTQSTEMAAATPNHDPDPVALIQPTDVAMADAVMATPNHDSHHAAAQVETSAFIPEILRAEPELAIVSTATLPPAPAFTAATTTLYAKANARLRAAPSTDADVVAKLPASAPLRATARSTDGAWWQVSLADGRAGYVRRDAVTKTQVMAKTNLPPTTAPASASASVAAMFPQPVPVRSRRTVFGTVEEAMNWLVDASGGTDGTPPKLIRPER